MTERRNLLLVVLGSGRADHLSCYGYGRETTPFLDEVAQQGVRFHTVISCAAAIVPAHASLLTGFYPVTHGATEETGMLVGRHRTLPAWLKAAGYRTAAFSTHPDVGPDTGFAGGVDEFVTQRRHSRLATRAVSYGRRASDRLLRREDAGARRTNDAFKHWLETVDGPYGAVVRYDDTSLPLAVPPAYAKRFVPVDISAARARELAGQAEAYTTGTAEITDESRIVLNGLYDGALRYVDERVRELADILRERGDWDQTTLVVTADHGDHLGDHGQVGHAFGLSDAVLRIPLLIRSPWQVPQGFVVQDLAQNTDVLPTVLHLLGISADSERFQGRVLLERGRATPSPGFVIAERYRSDLQALRERCPDFDARPVNVRLKAIRTKRDKFIWHSDEANELYDLSTDPGEVVNLADTAVDRADALRRQLFDWLAVVDKFQADEPVPGAPRRTR
jgi:arylsulfatase A-like enzyme